MTALRLMISLIAGILSLLFSLAASPSYGLLLSAALLFAVLHFVAGAMFLQLTHTRTKWLLIVLGAPVLAYAIDDIGRLLALLGLSSFRILA